MNPARNISSPAVGTGCPPQQFHRGVNSSAEWLGVAETGDARDSDFFWFSDVVGLSSGIMWDSAADHTEMWGGFLNISLLL